jgi:peptide-methionine (S)-S-oxide reductase
MTLKKTILAGGCFWGMEDLFRRQPGVTGTRVGYTGGTTDNPRYEDIKTGATGHAESIEVTYDDTRTDFRDLLEFFFQMHDPTTANRQGNDCGSQYRSAIFYIDEEQRDTAAALIREIDDAKFLSGPVVTEIVPAGPFYEAEGYHQNYLETHSGGYTCHFVRPNWRLGKNSAR